jgi:fructokinase
MARSVCLGEALIDFVSMQAGLSLVEAAEFEKNPGGAPANVAVGLARLGVGSAFMGKVGADEFGDFLIQVFEDEGVDTNGVVLTAEARTGLAFVAVAHSGEREFLFYRHPSADMLYTLAEVNTSAELIRSADCFHFGSNSLTSEPARSATMGALAIASRSGVRISYDPNIRVHMWPDEESARNEAMKASSYANWIKLSEEELLFLSQQDSLERGAERLWHDRLQLLVVTQGARGCRYFTTTDRGRVSGFAVRVADTTGAGDGFMAGMLFGLTQDPDLIRDEDRLRDCLRFANAAGALTVTGRGAMRSLPHPADVEALLRDERDSGSEPSAEES